MKCQAYFNIFGLILEFGGVILLAYYAEEIAEGLTGKVDKEHLGVTKWFYIAIALIFMGFLAQLIGNIVYLFTSP